MFQDETLLTLAELFLVLFDESVNHQVSIAKTNVMPSSDFNSGASATGTVQSGSCPTGQPVSITVVLIRVSH